MGNSIDIIARSLANKAFEGTIGPTGATGATGATGPVGEIENVVKTTVQSLSLLEQKTARENLGLSSQMEDLRFPATQTRQGANAFPVFDYERLGFLFPQNNEAHIAYYIVQFSHGREADSDVFPHVHTALEKAGQPIFVLKYAWYNPSGDIIPELDLTYIMNENTATWESGIISNMIYGQAPLSGLGKNASSMLIGRLYRQTGDGYVGNVLMQEFDVHYFQDKFGENFEPQI